MSQVAMTVIDAHRAIHSQPHGSFTDAVVAALSADPETIEELAAALARFVRPGEVGPFAHWHQGVSEEPFDAGVCIVDLAARLVAVRSTFSMPGPEGEVEFHDGQRGTDVWLRYHLSEEWAFSDNIEAWEGPAESRRRQRLANPPLDARQALYGRVCEFLVKECVAARSHAPRCGTWTPPVGWSLPERAKSGEGSAAANAVAEIHARWLVTPRDDLGGQSPRDVLLAKKHHLSWDLQDRCEQWSMLGECPPGLNVESAAFRCGGFGTHENVLYYELVRELVCDCWEHVVEPTADAAPSQLSEADEVLRLRQVREQWLNTPQNEDLGSHSPAYVIQRERERLPMAISGHRAAVDDDCPLCQMLAEGSGPVFWNLDGCNMDQDFPFSFCRTRAEWEEEQRRYEEFSRRFDEEQKRRQAGSMEDAMPWNNAPEGDSVWKRNYSDPDTRNAPPSIRLFGIGGHVAELQLDLKDTSDTASLAESLNGQFGNLRAALDDRSGSLLGPVVDCFCRELDAVAAARPELAPKCGALGRQLQQFAADVADEEGPSDIPF